MISLREITAGMLASQEKLQELYIIRTLQLAGRWPNSPIDLLRNAVAVETHREFIGLMSRCLTQHPAANDATTLPGAA